MSSVLENPAVRRMALPISVAQYHSLGHAGLIEQETELLRGVIVAKMIKSPRHSFLVQMMADWARSVVPLGYHVRQEQPITLADSEPEPDVAIVLGQPSDYCDAHPSSALVIIEVAVSSSEIDREKANIYAEIGVSEYAIVLHAEKAIEVFSQPTASGYAVKQRLQGEQDQLRFASLSGHAFTISKLFS